MEVSVYLMVGAFAGLCSGLLGVGGGVVVVPALSYLLFHYVTELPHNLLMHMAIGTSLAVMMVTSAASSLAHHRLQTVNWLIWRRWLVGLLLGTVLGVVVVKYIPTTYLKYIFGVFLFLVAFKMLFNAPSQQESLALNRYGWPVAGSFVGLFSGLLGVGGGVLMVPLLNRCGLKMSQAAGTAAASTFPIAVCGAISNVLVGWDATQEISGCFGFIYLPAFVAIVPATFVMAPVGAKLSRKIPAVMLKRVFGLFLMIIVIGMVK